MSQKKSDIGSPFSAGSYSVQAKQSFFISLAVDQHVLQVEPSKALLKDVTSETQVKTMTVYCRQSPCKASIIQVHAKRL
ncbi:uncharacterized protein IAS62_003761 [Cryptococcus decagattii]|uniref:Uncharacterized protein n=1 Tax=Cryptococcus decagattii TaxID=1859122 RepID=A0ABZ2AYJ3_9TREE